MINSLLPPLMLIAFLFSLSSCGEKPEQSEEHTAEETRTKIVVLATHHRFPDSSKLEAQEILQKLKSYEPDLIATEQSPHYDTISLRKYESTYYSTFTGIREEMQLTTEMLLDSIGSYHEASGENYSLDQLAHLARLYYLLGDRSNYQYYIYQVMRQEDRMTSEQQVKVKDIIGRDLYERVTKRLHTSEYGLIVYPLAVSQKIQELVPVDHQSKADSFVYWQKHHYDVLIEKYTKPVYDSIIKAYQRTNHTSHSMTQQNTYAYLQEYADFHRPIPGLEYDSFSVAKTLEPWNYRNEMAIRRLDSAIQATGSKRALITFGGMHAPPFLRILKDYTQYDVLILEDLDE